MRKTEREAFHDPVHRQGHHDRRDGEIGDRDAIDEPDRESEPEREQHCRNRAIVVAQRRGGEQDRTRCVQHPRHGEVDTADEDHEGLPGGDEADERRDDEDRLDAPGAGEAGVEERSDDEDEDRRAEGDENSATIHGQKVPRSRAGTGALDSLMRVLRASQVAEDERRGGRR